MRKIACKEVTGWECDFVAEGNLNTEVKNKFHSHLTQVHDADLGADADAKKAKMQELEKKAASKLPWL